MREAAWVIERGDSEVSAPLYYAPQMNSGWDTDHLRACRFARKEDAQVVADAYGLDIEYGMRICEHVWDNTDEICFHFTEANRVLFTIKADGTIERGSAFTTVDEMSLKFWELVEKYKAEHGPA